MEEKELKNLVKYGLFDRVVSVQRFMQNSPEKTAEQLDGLVPVETLENLYIALCEVVSCYEVAWYNKQKEQQCPQKRY